MDASDTALARLRRWNLLWLLTVAFAVIVLAGFWTMRATMDSTERLNTHWRGETLHIYSAKDGPFIVTHLFRHWSNSIESSVAQLPQPITIIDSRGYDMSADEIAHLTWIGASGRTNPPPPKGMPLRAFYIVPQQTE